MTNIFENASSVVINNKEVQSIIITSNNAVIYQKEHDLQLTSNKNILSYYDNETATLTAILTENGTPITGETVTMKAYNSTQTTLLDTLTVTDNQDGTYTAEYDSTGVGDIVILCECGLLQETYVIEDCVIYKTTPISITGTSTSDTVYSIGIDDIGYDLSNKDFDIEWVMNVTDKGEQFNIGAKSEWSVNPIKGNYRVHIGCSSGGYRSYGIRDTSSNHSTTGNFSTNTDHTCKISKSSSTFTYTVDDTQLGTKTENWWSNYSSFSVYIVQWNKGTTTISNLKIKPV